MISLFVVRSPRSMVRYLLPAAVLALLLIPSLAGGEGNSASGVGFPIPGEVKNQRPVSVSPGEAAAARIEGERQTQRRDLQSETESAIVRLLRAVAESGRVLEAATPVADRVLPPGQIAPGIPPLISFRYFDGRQRHRFGGLDLVLDDASH
ncbi:MAG TPA: hypothetical protein VGK99_21300 [Acidobacteriota bacterium]